MDNERDTGLRPADTERQDRIDLLRGRLDRLAENYEDERVALLARLRWVNETKERERGLTLALYDTQIAPSLPPSLEKLQAALRQWLVTREELAALEGKKR